MEVDVTHIKRGGVSVRRLFHYYQLSLLFFSIRLLYLVFFMSLFFLSAMFSRL